MLNLKNTNISMKKIAVLAFISVVAFSSCKKQYTCSCTYPASSGIRNTDAQSGKLKKSDADTWCDNADNGAKILGGSCKLQ